MIDVRIEFESELDHASGEHQIQAKLIGQDLYLAAETLEQDMEYLYCVADILNSKTRMDEIRGDLFAIRDILYKLAKCNGIKVKQHGV